MRNFDLQIIWSAQTPFIIPGFLALHVHIEAERTVVPANRIVEKYFLKLVPEEKAAMGFLQLN